MRGTQALAEGRLDERVSIGGRDEIQQLGEAFNTMAERLVELQADVRRQERQAMFGRVASGLAHDLSTPIMNVGNSCKLIVRMWNDEEYRETFRRTVDRELHLIKEMLDDLRNVAKPMLLARHPVDLNRSVADVVESMRTMADEAKVELEAALSLEPLVVDGDVTALGRVHRNLIANAIQATAAGGRVRVETAVVRRPRDPPGHRHRLRHRPGAHRLDLRRLRDDEAPGPRPRPRRHQTDRRAARRQGAASRARSARARRSRWSFRCCPRPRRARRPDEVMFNEGGTAAARPARGRPGG